tara:strand:- start:212 stop:367 length:156 start_codon:yes stop_codon:yes gene_type:complete
MKSNCGLCKKEMDLKLDSLQFLGKPLCNNCDDKITETLIEKGEDYERIQGS